MAQYAIAFDLDTRAMREDGLSQADITIVYQRELPAALTSAGFTAHPQGSLYHTEADHDPITALMILQATLKRDAPNFCKFARRVHVFRMEEWSDVTELLADRPSAGEPTAEEEIEEQEAVTDVAEAVA